MAFANTKSQSQISFVIIFIINLSSIARADLITDVCSKTQQPGYCRRCINSFLIIRKDTVRDLAVVAIDCAIYQASVVHSLLGRYSQTAPLPEVSRCVSTYGGIEKALRQAGGSWRDYKYAQARSLLDSARSSHWSCFNLLVKARWNIPVDLANEFYTFTSYDDVAKSILTQL